MTEDWSHISGLFTLQTGKDLRDQPLHIMYDVTYAYARQSSIRTKEENDALVKLDRMIRETQDDFETGLPAFVRQFGPADQ